MNPILNADAYTISSDAFASDSARTRSVYNFTNRIGPTKAFPEVAKTDAMCFYGLSHFYRKVLMNPWTHAHVDEAVRFMGRANSMGGGLHFPEKLARRVVDEFSGYLPVRVHALPEGTAFFPNEPVIEVESLDGDFGELAAHLEASMVGMVSIATARATLTRHWYQRIVEWLQAEMSSEDARASASWFIHDFGARASSCPEEAELLGMAHLLTFKGTDTFGAAAQAWREGAEDGVGTSILALAHRNVQGYDIEEDCFKRMVEVCRSNGGIASFVADCYDFQSAVRTLVRLAKENTDVSVVIRPDCYDEETEILTENGWVRFSELDNEKVAQFHPMSNDISFVEPTRKMCYDYNGKMISVKNTKGGVDLVVTPNHRMFKVNSRNTNDYKVEEAECVIYNTNWRHVISGYKCRGKYKSLSPLDRLKIAFQADGSFPSHNPNGELKKDEIALRFTFTKQRKIDRLEKICKDGDFRYSINSEPARPNQKVFYVWVNEQMSKTFDWINLSEITGDWAKEFMSELPHWDGTVRDENRDKYDTTIKSNVDTIQALASLCGYRTTYGLFVDSRKEHFSDIHSLSIVHRNYHNTQNFIKQNIEYSGKVYCVQVPSSLIIVRRNGCVAVCGNSGPYVDNIVKIVQSAYDAGVFKDRGTDYDYPSNIRYIQGDSGTPRKVQSVLNILREERFSGWGIFGVGGYLRNNCTRDTLSSAYKLCAIDKDNRDVCKLSEVKGKMSVPGLTVLHDRHCEPLVEVQTGKVPDIRQTYYDGSKFDDYRKGFNPHPVNHLSFATKRRLNLQTYDFCYKDGFNPKVLSDEIEAKRNSFYEKYRPER